MCYQIVILYRLWWFFILNAGRDYCNMDNRFSLAMQGPHWISIEYVYNQFLISVWLCQLFYVDAVAVSYKFVLLSLLHCPAAKELEHRKLEAFRNLLKRSSWLIWHCIVINLLSLECYMSSRDLKIKIKRVLHRKIYTWLNNICYSQPRVTGKGLAPNTTPGL